MTFINKSAEYWIDHLELLPHPEGGFFRETYRSNVKIEATGSPDRFGGSRNASTGIYFLLRSQDISHLHRIDADEMWHFYAGSPLTVHMIDDFGEYSAHKMGANPDAGEMFQAVVPAGRWFGSTIDAPESYALVGCTVAPGFEFSGFEMAKKSDMFQLFPQHAELLERITLD